jgi:DNA-binding GntR family transcriptional regulator
VYIYDRVLYSSMKPLRSAPKNSLRTAGGRGIGSTKVDERISHADAIYRYLEKEIFAGRLEPGDRIDDAGLAAQFGVSRTPVREALLQLVALDLVELRPRQGAVVAAIPLAQMAQMFEVMAELEGLCAALATQRMTLAERKQLERAATQCRKLAQSMGEDASERYFDANYAFHQVIYQGAHNEYLSQATASLRNRLAPYRRFRRQSAGRMKNSSREHDAILNAILAGESEVAAREMRQHLTIQSAVLADLIASLPRKLEAAK